MSAIYRSKDRPSRDTPPSSLVVTSDIMPSPAVILRSLRGKGDLKNSGSMCSNPRSQETQHLRIGWIGFHMEGQAALEGLLHEGISVEAVITLAEPELAKRSGVGCYNNICDRYGVPLYKIHHINDQESVELLEKLDLDVACVIGWSQIIGRAALKTARLGMIGAHAALLPHNRGSAPVNWALIRNETEAGNTLMWLNEEIDEGEIIDQVQFPLTLYDTCATVYEKVAETNREMILRLIPRLMAGQRPARPQPHSTEPLLPRRRPKDGLIDWSKDSLDVYNFIRALARPYPGAFSWLQGRQYRIWDAALLPGNPYADAMAGQVLGPIVSPYPCQACGQVVACGNGAVVILELESTDGTVFKGKELIELTSKGKYFTNEQ